MAEAQAALEWALSRWSIAVQLGIVLVLALLFSLAWFSTRRTVLLTWTLAWFSDVLALSSVLGIALLLARLSLPEMMVLYLVYSATKFLFVLLLALGLHQYRRAPAAMGRSAWNRLLLGAAAWTVLVALIADTPVRVQTLTYGGAALVLVAGSLPSLGPRNPMGSRIAGTTLLVEGLVFLHHCVVLLPSFWGGTTPAYMSRISFLDSIVEFLVGLGCILALGLRAMEEGREAERRVEASERTLRSLVDADPLTGLWNRRRLRRFVDGTPEGGTVFFIDVDRFKAVNDSWGHATGDACLVRVAEAMRTVFRSTDGLFRVGGDEFLVVAPGMGASEASRRAREFRELLARADERGIALSVSVGTAPFGDGVRLDEAMAAADAAMYREKSRLS